jgi:hypothetical protein
VRSFNRFEDLAAGSREPVAGRSTMMAKNHGSSVKDDKQYEALRRQGEGRSSMSKKELIRALRHH